MCKISAELLNGMSNGFNGLKLTLSESCKYTKIEDCNTFSFDVSTGKYKALVARQIFFVALPQLFFYKYCSFIGNLAQSILHSLSLLFCWINKSQTQLDDLFDWDYLKNRLLENLGFFLGASLGDLIAGCFYFVGTINPLWVHSYALTAVFSLVKRVKVYEGHCIQDSQDLACDYLIEKDWSKSSLDSYDQESDEIEFMQEKWDKFITNLRDR